MTEYEKIATQLTCLISEGRKEILALKRAGKSKEAEELETDIQLEIEMLKPDKLKAFLKEDDARKAKEEREANDRRKQSGGNDK